MNGNYIQKAPYDLYAEGEVYTNNIKNFLASHKKSLNRRLAYKRLVSDG